MSDKIIGAEKERWQMLKAFYDALGGEPAAYSRVNFWHIGESLGFDRNKSIATYEYLRSEGLLESRALGGWATITHWGIKEVEDIVKGRETEHFDKSVNVNINIIGQNSGNIAIGDQNTQFQAATDPKVVVAELKRALEAVERPLPNEALTLLKLATDSPDDRLALTTATSLLAQKGPQWRTALERFATEVGAGFTGSLLIEMIKLIFGISGR